MGFKDFFLDILKKIIINVVTVLVFVGAIYFVAKWWLASLF